MGRYRLGGGVCHRRGHQPGKGYAGMNSVLLMIGYTVLALLVALCIAAVIVGNRDDDWPE